MKITRQIIITLLVLLMAGANSFAQTGQNSTQVNHKITKQNGTEFVGTIVSQDAREVLLNTVDIGLVYIPKHEIEKIIEIKEGNETLSGGLFATRYFLTTNGFNISKGDNYVQWNVFGPDFQWSS